MTEKQIKARLKELSAEQDTLHDQLDEIKARKTLKCQKCGKRTQVKKLTLIQTHWYVRPYGCTGGDYWNEGEKQFDCPKCGFRNRDYFDKKIKKLARYFKKTVDECDD